MRLIITVEPEEKEMLIPYNYHYFLCQNFMRILDNSSFNLDIYNLNDPNFPINQNGYILDVAFSTFRFYDEFQSTENGIILNGNVSFNFSIPNINRNLIIELVEYLMHKSIPVHYIKNKPNKFKIININQPSYKIYNGLICYKLLSPICLGNIKLNDKCKLNINEVEFIIDKLILNLKLKFLKFYNRYFDREIEIYFFTDIYSKDKLLDIYKELNIRVNRKEWRNVTLLNIPVAVNTSSEMQNVILNCGLGLYNYLGFGYLNPSKISNIYA